MSILFLEGWGMPYGHEITFYIVAISPIILYSIDKFEEFEWKIPMKVILFLKIFVVLLIISTFFSIDIENSFEKCLNILSGFIFFIYAYNHRQNLRVNLEKIFIPMGVVFILYSLVVSIFSPFLKNILPTNTFQLVYSTVGNHNHLGDFLLIPFTYAIFEYLCNKNIKNLIFAFIFFIAIVFSFSRSAYVALAISIIYLLIWFQKKVNKKILFSSFFLIVLLAFFSFQYLQLGKVIFGNRELYFKQAVTSIIEKPSFGIGSGNFSLISNKYSDKNYLFTDSASSSHNIFLDYIVENGVFVGFLMIFAYSFIILKGRRDWYYFAIFALLINFQLDYTFNIYSILILVLIFSGFTINLENDESSVYPSILASICAVFGIYLILTNIIITTNQRAKWTFYFNPINKTISQNVISQLIIEKKYSESLNIMNLTSNMHLGDVDYMEYLAVNFEKFNNKKAAAIYYKKACDAVNRYDCFYFFKKIVSLDKSIFLNKDLKNNFNFFISEIYSAGLNMRNNKSLTDRFFLNRVFRIDKSSKLTHTEYINMVILICKQIDPVCKYNYFFNK
jgi:O-antigen ligase